MSVSSGLSGRYAKAIYILAEEKKILKKIIVDFMKLKKLLDENDSLTNLIKSPAISKSDKQNSIIKILNKAKAQKLTTNFFCRELNPVSVPTRHTSADKQVTGEAIYTDDTVFAVLN